MFELVWKEKWWDTNLRIKKRSLHGLFVRAVRHQFNIFEIAFSTVNQFEKFLNKPLFVTFGHLSSVWPHLSISLAQIDPSRAEWLSLYFLLLYIVGTTTSFQMRLCNKFMSGSDIGIAFSQTRTVAWNKHSVNTLMESSCKISILPFSLSKVSQVNIRTKRERDGKVDGKG